MLTELGLRNFKAFGDEMQRAPLAPITLIYGPNSGGKSSIIQALLLLKQSHRIDDNQPYTRFSLRWMSMPLELVTSGNLVDLGSYPSVIHMHDTSRSLEVCVGYEVNELSDHLGGTKWIGLMMLASDTSPTRLMYDTNQGSWVKGKVGMTFTSGTPQVDKIQTEFESSIGPGYKMGFMRCTKNAYDWLDEDMGNSSRESYVNFIRGIDKKFASKKATEENSSQVSREFLRLAANLRHSNKIPQIAYRHWQGSRHGVFYAGLPDQIGIGDSNISIDENGIYVNHISGLRYLGPLMADPKRYYDSSEHSMHDYDVIGVRGENVPFILLKDENLKESVNGWLERFDVPYTIDAVSVSNNEVIGNELVAMYLTHKCWGPKERQQTCDANHPKTTVTLADVGFGVNQMLPVILQGVTSYEKIICVEQPEIHLHPRLQSHMADLLIETIQSPPEPLAPGTSNQWIVETHSELIVRRLQRRIREGKISNEDVCVLYVDPQDDGSSTIERLELDEDGRFIDEWPHGFFDEGYREIMGY